MNLIDKSSVFSPACPAEPDPLLSPMYFEDKEAPAYQRVRIEVKAVINGRSDVNAECESCQ